MRLKKPAACGYGAHGLQSPGEAPRLTQYLFALSLAEEPDVSESGAQLVPVARARGC